MSQRQVEWFSRFKNLKFKWQTKPGRPGAKNCAKFSENICEIIAIDGNFTVRMLTDELNTNRETVCLLVKIMEYETISSYKIREENMI